MTFVVTLCIVCFYVLFVCKCVLPPGDNPIAVNKYIIIISSLTNSILFRTSWNAGDAKEEKRPVSKHLGGRN